MCRIAREVDATHQTILLSNVRSKSLQIELRYAQRSPITLRSKTHPRIEDVGCDLRSEGLPLDQHPRYLQRDWNESFGSLLLLLKQRRASVPDSGLLLQHCHWRLQATGRRGRGPGQPSEAPDRKPSELFREQHERDEGS